MNQCRILWLLALWLFKSTSSISQFYFNISNRRGVPVKLLRKYEELSYKLAKKSLDKEFFATCLDLEMCPDFLKFRPPRLEAYKSTNLIYKQVVRQQLEFVQSEVHNTKHKWSEVRSVVFEHLSLLEKRCLTKLVEQQVAKKIANDKCTINKKLQRT